MEETSSLIISQATGKALDKIWDKFKESVLYRYSRYRSLRFFYTFLGIYKEEIEADDFENRIFTNDKLEKILEDDNKSKILFEAYRRVAFSASKDLGPAIIGLLTSELILENRFATEEEERIFQAAESLSDQELIEFERHCAKEFEEGQDDFELELDKKWIDSNWNKNEQVYISPVNLGSVLGTWALKLKNIGIITEFTTDKTTEYFEDSERHIDEDGEVREIKSFIKIDHEYNKFCKLISRSRDYLNFKQ